MAKCYCLFGRRPVPCSEEQWETTFHRLSEAFIVDMTWVDEVLVSTVFVGRDSGNCSDMPLVFETTRTEIADGSVVVVLKGSTWEEAESQHRAVVESVKLEQRV